jgi:cobalt-zinc-cadmium efflux system protein
MSHNHSHSNRESTKNNLRLVFLITLIFLIAEVIGGILTKSLALLADAGHMLTDVAALGLTIFAMRLSERPASSRKTYGYYRAEILAALANAVVLIGISFYVLYEAYERFKTPPKIESIPMLLVACVGLAVNIIGVLLLKRDSKTNLNLKGAYFEVLADAVTSVGVILGAIVIWVTGWYQIDALISAGIGLFILPRTWKLLTEAAGILLEGAPADIDIALVRQEVEKIIGVVAVHDLHVWTITSEMHALSMHVVVKSEAPHNHLLSIIHKIVTSNFNIQHVTVQIEHEGFQEKETHL